MATNITKVPLFRIASARAYSQAVPVNGVVNYDVKSSALPNKVIVTSIDNESALSRVSIAFRAGSRNEDTDNLGVTHILRIAAGLSTSNSSQFAITRNVQQVGARLTCTADRETIAYTMEGTKDAVEAVVPFLTDVTTKQMFKPWELADTVNRTKLELATRPPQQRAIDLLHKAAFRTGLGNSIYTSKHQMGNITTETLLHYVNSTFTAGRAAVVGVGVDHNLLAQYAQGLELAAGEGVAIKPSPYKGGEIRSDKGGNYAFVAIGAAGGSTKNLKEYLAFSVLRFAYGGAPSVKWSAADNGVLSQATKVGQPNALTAFNASYSDAGLFGVLIAAEGKVAGGMVDAAVKVLKDGNVDDAAVNRAKNQLKVQILEACEGGDVVNHLAKASLTWPCVPSSPSDFIAAIDAITSADVNAAAKKVAGSKLSLASVGNLRTVPFLDEIK